MHSHATRRGFTLVEFMIAIAVLIFGVYGIFDQFVKIKGPSDEDLLRAQMQWFAHQELQELRACSYEALGAFEAMGTFAPDEVYPHFHVKPQVLKRSDGLIEITVQVGWQPSDGTDQNTDQKFDRLIEVKGVRSP